MDQADQLYGDLLTTLTHNVGLSATKTPTTFVADAALRDAAGAKGYTVTWNAADNTIVLTKGDTAVTLTLGSKTAQKGGEEISLSKAPYAEQGVTYVPMDFVNSL